MEKYQNKYRIPSTRLQQWDYRWAGAYFITICTKNRRCYFGEIANQQMQLSHIGIIADVLWHQIPHHANNIELGAFVVMPNHIHGILVINEIYTNTKNDTANRNVNPRENVDRDVNGNGKPNVYGNNNGNGNGYANGNGNGNVDDNGNVVDTGHALYLPSESPSESRSESPSESPSESRSPLPESENHYTKQSESKPKTIGQQRFQNIGKNSISSVVGSYKSAVTKHAHRLGFEFEWQALFHDHIIRDDASFKRITNYIISNPSNWKDDKFFNKE